MLPWHIHNSSIFRILAHSEPEAYSESWAIHIPGVFRTGGILRTLPNFHAGLTFSPEVFCLCKIAWGGGGGVEGPRIVNFDIPPQRFTVILLITFDLQHF